jgi:hypothetical protein
MDEKLFIQFWMNFLNIKIKEMKTLDEKSYIQFMDENLYTWMNPISSKIMDENK